MQAARGRGGPHGHRDATLLLLGYPARLRAFEFVGLRWDGFPRICCPFQGAVDHAVAPVSGESLPESSIGMRGSHPVREDALSMSESNRSNRTLRAENSKRPRRSRSRLRRPWWSLEEVGVDTAPRGDPQALENALKLFAPNDQQAILRRIEWLARGFNAHAAKEAAAPTDGEIAHENKKFAQKLEQACKALMNLSDFARGDLLGVPCSTELEEFIIELLPKYIIDDDEPTGPDLFMILRTWSDIAKRAAEERSSSRTRKSAFLSLYKTAKWMLSAKCGSLLLDCGTVPRGSTGGDLHKLVRGVYDYATGHDSETERTGLDYYVKRVGGLFARRFALESADLGSEGRAAIQRIDRELWPALELVDWDDPSADLEDES
jgi:hypothetical protein